MTDGPLAALSRKAKFEVQNDVLTSVTSFGPTSRIVLLRCPDVLLSAINTNSLVCLGLSFVSTVKSRGDSRVSSARASVRATL